MLIALLALVVGKTQAATPVDELDGLQVASLGDAVTSSDAFDGETWFVFQVGGTGRTGYAYYDESYDDYYNGAVADLTGVSTSIAAVYLFKVIPNEDGTFSLEDGVGNYLAVDPSSWDCYPADEDDSYITFTIAQIDSDTDETVWYLQEATGGTILDTNPVGSSLAGWDTTVPTSTTGNNAMTFYPVTLEEAEESDAITVTSGLYTNVGDNATELETDKWYYINNCPNGSRTGWIYRSGTSYYNAESAPDMNTLSEDVTNYLFRLVENEDGTYYIIDGDGYYLSLSTYTIYGSLLAANTWTISKIDEESDAAAFSALSTGTSYYLDTNGVGYTVAGWPGTPTVDGNECVYFVEVLFDDETFLTADAAPEDLAGRYAIELGEFSSEDYSSASSLETSFNGKITVDDEGMVLLTGLIGTPGYSSWDWDTWMSVSVDSCYVGYYNESEQTITFVFPEEDEDGNVYEIYDDNWDSWVLASRFTVNVSQNDEGLYVLSTDDDIPFTYSYNSYTVTAAGVTMTQKQTYTIAEEDLVGTWQLTYPATNSWGEATGEDATLTFEIGYNDDGELILYNFGGLDYEFVITYTGTGFTLPYTYVSEWDEETYDTTFWLYFDTLNQTGADVEFVFGEDTTILIGDDGLYFDAFGTEVGDGETELFYYITEGTAVKILGSAISSLDELDNETTYAIYNETFTTYLVYDEDLGDEYVGGAGMIGDSSHTLAADTPDFDASLEAHNWMVYKKANYYYIYNIGLGKYFVGPTDDVEAATFSDTATPVYFTDLGDGKFALNSTTSDDATWYDYNFACAAPQLAGSTPIAAWTYDDSGSAWQFIPTSQVEAAETSVFDAILTDAAPEDLAGRYTIELGEFTSDDYSDASSLETSFTGKITIDEDGKVLLTGLIGTPYYYEMDWDTWATVEVDSCYVGYYNAQEGIIEFYYPQATEDGNEFDIIDDDWEDWQLSGTFTVSVSQNEDGLYVLSTDDLITFIYTYYEYVVSATGVTMTQIQDYEIEKDALVGLWTLTYPTVNSWGEETGGESTLNLIIAEDEDGELYISKFGDLEYTIPMTYETTYLTIPMIYEFAYDSSTYETTSYVFIDDENGAGNGAEIYFGESNTLIIGDEGLQVYAFGTDFGDEAEFDYWINSGTAEKAVEITPESGEYDELPTEVVLRTYGWDIDEETVAVAYHTGSDLKGAAIDSENITVAGDSIVIAVPEDVIEDEYYLTLSINATDVKGYTVTNLGTATITADYSTPVPANTYTISTIDPSTDETQSSLSEFTITMSIYNDLIGGFDETKTIVLLSEDVDTITTATIVRNDDDTSSATITLAEEVTEEGTYTLVIPEGLIYNSSYNADADDLGVEDGAIYNPEYTATYTVGLVLGDAITSLDELSTETAYVIYNEHFTTYMIYDAESSDTYVWGAGMVGDDSHTLSAETPEIDLDDPAHSWMVGEKDGNYYIYNLGLGQYFVSANDDYAGAHFSETATNVYIEQLGDITFSLNSTTTDDTEDSEYYFACAAPQLVSSGTPIAWWTSDDDGSAWQFIVNPNVEADASFLDSIETGISTVTASDNEASGIYTLSGIKLNATDVRKLPKGVYVVDGEKVLVK